MPKKPVRREPAQKKPIKPAGKPTELDFSDMDDDDFEEDFTYKEAVRMLQAEYGNFKVTPELEGEIRAYIKAADTEGKPGLREAGIALNESLDEMMDDGITARRVLASIYQFVDGGVVEKPRETPAETKRRLIGAMEVAAAAEIDRINAGIAKDETALTTKTKKALAKLARDFREGHPGEQEAGLLSFIAEAAIDGKLPQQSDARYFEQLKRKASDHLLQEVLDGSPSLTRRVMNDAILAAAADVTASLTGGVRK